MCIILQDINVKISPVYHQYDEHYYMKATTASFRYVITTFSSEKLSPVPYYETQSPITTWHFSVSSSRISYLIHSLWRPILSLQ